MKKMTTLELKSTKRIILGKKVKTLRKKGQIPAVVYGGKNYAAPLVLDEKEFNKVFKNAGETTLIKLFFNVPEESESANMPAGQSDRHKSDDEFKNVLIHDVSRDPVTDKIIHIDFYEVKMDEKIIAKVPLEFIGVPPAVSDLGGILVKAIQELEVRALPANLPHKIEVDVSSLKTLDDNILVKDIKLPDGVEMLENLSDSAASIAPPRSEAELEALSGKIEENVEEVTAETEEKTAERAKETEEAVK